MKKEISTITLIPVFVLMACLWTNIASAGLINYKVKVTNSLNDSVVTVYLHYGKHFKEFTINPQSSHTFETGIKCPFKLAGFVQSPYHVTMIDRCTGGRESTSECLHTCWGSDWTIRRHDDGAFHFDKE